LALVDQSSPFFVQREKDRRL